AIAFPDGPIRFNIPLENAELSTARRDAETFLISPESHFSEFLLSDIEVDPEDPVTPDVCVADEPPFRAVRHTQPKLVVECFPTLDQAFLFGITCTPIFQRHALA